MVIARRHRVVEPHDAQVDDERAPRQVDVVALEANSAEARLAGADADRRVDVGARAVVEGLRRVREALVEPARRFAVERERPVVEAIDARRDRDVGLDGERLVEQSSQLFQMTLRYAPFWKRVPTMWWMRRVSSRFC